MTKKTFIIALAIFMLIPFGIKAQQGQGSPKQEAQGIHESGTGLKDLELKEANQGTGQALQDGEIIQNQNRIMNNATDTMVQFNNQQGQGNPNQEPKGNIDLEDGVNRGASQALKFGSTSARKEGFGNALQSMNQIAERNPEISEQMKIVSQNQNRAQLEAENALQKAQKRSSFARFFIGPNYGELKVVEDRLNVNVENLSELNKLRSQIKNVSDQSLLDEQIEVMEQIKTELEKELEDNKSGFSLFGWVGRLFNN